MGALVNTGDGPSIPTTHGAVVQGAPVAAGAVQPARAGVGPKGLVRTMLLASFALIFLFFSPFVSCANRTFTGIEAFQASLPSRNEQPKDGVLLIIFPIVGVTGALASFLAHQRISAGQSLRSVRGFAIGGLLSGLLALCPVGVGIHDTGQSNGMLTLLWGFWLSAAATITLGGASLLLLFMPDPLAAGASPPRARGQPEAP